MSSELARLFVTIGGDSKPLDGELAKVRSGLGNFAQMAGGIAARIGVAGAVAGLAGWLHGAVLSAGDLNETMSKTEVTFGKANDKVIGFAENMAAKFGTAKGEILNAAASFGLIFKGAGMAEDASASLSIKLAECADDAASLFNSSLPEALEKIRAGLVGESEPLRAYGVMLNEAAVQQEALRLGLSRGKAELSEQAKIMARASLIEKGLAVAKGDHARTQGGFNNQLKEFGDRMTNLGTSVGSLALTWFTPMITIANKALQVVGALADGVGKLGAAYKDLVAPEAATLIPRTGGVLAKLAEGAGPPDVSKVTADMNKTDLQRKAETHVEADREKLRLEQAITAEKEKQQKADEKERHRKADVNTAIELRRESEIRYSPSDDKLHAPSQDGARKKIEGFLSNAKERLGQAIAGAGALKDAGKTMLGKAAEALVKDRKPQTLGGMTDADSYAREAQDAALAHHDTEKAILDEAKKHSSLFTDLIGAVKAGSNSVRARFG